MSQPAYVPRPGSAPARAIAFFQANPDEELHVGDIVEKFDMHRGNVHTNLAAALDAGLLKRFRNNDGEYCYAAGEAIGDLNRGVDIDAVHARGATAAAPVKKMKRAPVEIDPAAVQVLTGIPLPGPAIAGRKKLDWNQLLDRMNPGQAAELPAACRATLSVAMARIHKAPAQAGEEARKFTLRVDKATATLRVWREV